MTCRGQSLRAVRRQREEDKAAALDRAIEYEDALPDSDKDCHMIDRQLLQELDEAAGDMAAVEERIRGICAKIAASGGPGQETLVPAIGVTSGNSKPSHGPGRGRPGWRAAVKDDPAVKATARPWKKIVCPVCRETMGSRRFQDVDYPILHKNDQTGEACKGSFVAGLPIEP